MASALPKTRDRSSSSRFIWPKWQSERMVSVTCQPSGRSWKKAAPDVGRSRTEGALRIDPAARGGDAAPRDVGAVDADVPAGVGRPVAREEPRCMEQDADRVDLLAGRAAGAPDDEAPAGARQLLEHRQHLVLERAELAFLAEEVSLVRGQQVDRLVPLGVAPGCRTAGSGGTRRSCASLSTVSRSRRRRSRVKRASGPKCSPVRAAKRSRRSRNSSGLRVTASPNVGVRRTSVASVRGAGRSPPAAAR